jgi:hypothetical protein
MGRAARRPGPLRRPRTDLTGCPPLMDKKPCRPSWLRLVFAACAALACAALCSCASLQAGPNGPNGCVGPPDYCTPFFGA